MRWPPHRSGRFSCLSRSRSHRHRNPHSSSNLPRRMRRVPSFPRGNTYRSPGGTVRSRIRCIDRHAGRRRSPSRTARHCRAGWCIRSPNSRPHRECIRPRSNAGRWGSTYRCTPGQPDNSVPRRCRSIQPGNRRCRSIERSTRSSRDRISFGPRSDSNTLRRRRTAFAGPGIRQELESDWSAAGPLLHRGPRCRPGLLRRVPAIPSTPHAGWLRSQGREPARRIFYRPRGTPDMR